MDRETPRGRDIEKQSDTERDIWRYRETDTKRHRRDRNRQRQKETEKTDKDRERQAETERTEVCSSVMQGCNRKLPSVSRKQVPTRHQIGQRPGAGFSPSGNTRNTLMLFISQAVLGIFVIETQAD